MVKLVDLGCACLVGQLDWLLLGVRAFGGQKVEIGVARLVETHAI
jgi:hypothetical protein